MTTVCVLSDFADSTRERNASSERRAQYKYPNVVKLERNPNYSARPRVITWPSGPLAKSAY